MTPQPSDVVRVGLTLKEGYRFEVDFGAPPVKPLEVDEYPPLGQGSGPNPTRMLGAAIAHCLGASLLFCLRKARIEPGGLGVEAEVSLTRNEKGRLRIGGVRVTLSPSIGAAERERIARCVELFEDFCVVTESVRNGIAVAVEVKPTDADLHGELLTASSS